MDTQPQAQQFSQRLVLDILDVVEVWLVGRLDCLRKGVEPLGFGLEFKHQPLKPIEMFNFTALAMVFSIDLR